MRILFVRFNALGDIILTTGLVEYIKKIRPDIQIDFVTSKHFASLLRDNPSVTHLCLLEKGASPKEIKTVARTLPAYDYIFDLHGVLKSRIFCRSLRGPVVRIKKDSLARRLYVKFRLMRSRLDRQVVEKYAQTCLPSLNIKIPEIEQLRPCLKTTKVDGLPDLTEKYVVIHPFASQMNKQWPYAQDLARLLVEAKIPTVIVGQGQLPWPKEVIDISNRTSLKQMKSVIAGASVTISTDSGPLHMAIAYKRATIGIFGPTTKELGFLPTFKNCHIFQDLTLECRPCHIHGGHRCPKKHFKCMRNIAAQEVFNKAHEMFNTIDKF